MFDAVMFKRVVRMHCGDCVKTRLLGAESDHVLALNIKDTPTRSLNNNDQKRTRTKQVFTHTR